MCKERPIESTNTNPTCDSRRTSTIELKYYSSIEVCNSVLKSIVLPLNIPKVQQCSYWKKCMVHTRLWLKHVDPYFRILEVIGMTTTYTMAATLSQDFLILARIDQFYFYMPMYLSLRQTVLRLCTNLVLNVNRLLTWFYNEHNVLRATSMLEQSRRRHTKGIFYLFYFTNIIFMVERDIGDILCFIDSSNAS